MRFAHIEVKLHKKISRYASLNHISLQEAIDRAIQQYIKERYENYRYYNNRH